jgi:hypothetical protein
MEVGVGVGVEVQVEAVEAVELRLSRNSLSGGTVWRSGAPAKMGLHSGRPPM